MGTIPAPNIAADALAISQVPANAAQEYARTAQLKQQTADLQQQQQERALQMEAQRRQLADQDALTRTIREYDPAKHTLADIPGMITANGGSGQAGIAAQTGLANQKKQLLALNDEQFAAEQRKADLIQGAHDRVTSAKPEDKQDAYTGALADLSKAGIDTSKEPPVYPGDEAFEGHLAPVRLHSAIVADAEKQRKADADAAKARSENATAAHQEMINDLTKNSKPGDFDKQIDSLIGGTDPLAKQQNTFVKAQVNAALGRGDLASAQKFIDQAYENQLQIGKEIDPRVQAGKVAVAGASAAARQKAQVGDYADASNPMIDMVGQNQIDLNTVMSRVPPAARVAFLTNLHAAYPDYDQAAFKNQMAAARKATSGTWADSRLAYNTALDHSKNLLTAIDALNNGDVQTLNSMKNFFKTEFGSPDVPDFKAIANAYNHEVTSVLSKGHITDNEIKEGGAVLPANASPQALRKVVNSFNTLMSGKRDELNKIIQASAGSKANSVLNVGSNAESGHIISIGKKRYQYKGSGATDDLNNYTEIPAKQ